MENLISHIEFLILEHEYVIIPDFGGFVLNKESAYIDEAGCVNPPSLRLGFNAELKYNDGLLAESYMQRYAISYDVACRQINETVKHIKNILITKKTIDFGGLGSMSMSDSRILFNPATANFSNHPAVWGCSAVDLKKLSEITIGNNVPEIKKIPLKFITSVAATAAVALLFLSIVPFNNDLLQKAQQSGFVLSLIEETSVKVPQDRNITVGRAYILEDYIKEKNALASQQEEVKELVVVSPVPEKTVVYTKPAPVPQKNYYIVVGSDTEKVQANRILSKFKNAGFSKASIVDSSNRHRIYVASFTNKDEANVYLSRFRAKYPAYKDAWLFTKRK